ncbi:hypothetical protein LSAT2_018765, partial [Lamellibrachia satsuma]
AATQMRSPDGKFECVNETTWKGDTARILAGECKMLHARGDGKSYGVGITVSEEISKDVVRVE